MFKPTHTLGFILSILAFNLYAGQFNSPIWNENYELPGKKQCINHRDKEICFSDGNRKNVYGLTNEELEKSVTRGSVYSLNYPVDVTRMRLPKDAMEKFFNSSDQSALRRFVFSIAKKLTQFKSFDDIFIWLGLHEYPKTQAEIGPNHIPDMGELEEFHMGVSEFLQSEQKGLSFSCAACHSADLFGTKVLGMTNRFPRANEAFILGKDILSKTPNSMFKLLVKPQEHDYLIFKEAKTAMKFVGLKSPLALGLDTSLAQVGLSLDKRAKDEYASLKPPTRRRNQPKNPLNSVPADSKPAVWWNLKYKTKWLSDASIISGNPIHTNFLWNEIGRGVNLRELEKWLNLNKKKVEDLTAYVFHTEPPRYEDFFPEGIDINLAKIGQNLFQKNCTSCHGIYEKNWDFPNAFEFSYKEKLQNSKVWYHSKTKVVNVGTDSHRSEGMNYFYKDLNRLKISKEIGTVVKPSDGYVPPPLIGIWARWPYFHNNSIPSLYEVLTPDFKRVKSYIAVPAQSKITDFDPIKNGYPEKGKIRNPYKTDPDYKFDSSIKGLSNKGHTKMLLNDYGEEKFSHEDKLAIIEFLKTL